ncbi:MAG: helix-turn-helix domain-containing protein [Marinifilaceae bacterium]
MKKIDKFLKEKRKEVNLTQEEFAEKTGVALTVIRKIEQGKTNLNMDKVNQVLMMFGHTLVCTDFRDVEE